MSFWDGYTRHGIGRAYHRGPAAQQVKTDNAAAAPYGAGATSLIGPANTGAEALANSPGYSPKTQAAINNTSMDAINASTGAAATKGAENASATRNGGSFDGLLRQLAQQRGEQVGDQTAKNQIAFANDQQEQQNKGLAAEEGLIGTEGGLQAKNLESATQGANAIQQSENEPWAKSFQSFAQGLGSLGA